MHSRSSSQHTAISARLGLLFERQRRALLSCLDLLDRQRQVIGLQDAERLAAHIHAQGLLDEELAGLQKATSALEGAYHRLFPGGEAAVESLRAQLAALSERVLAANARNRGLLKAEMEGLRKRLQGLRLGRRVFASEAREAQPALIDITT